MPKAILEFKLPEEQDDFIHAQRGINYKIAMEALDTWLRNLVKYDGYKAEKMHAKTLEKIRDKLCELMHNMEEV